MSNLVALTNIRYIDSGTSVLTEVLYGASVDTLPQGVIDGMVAAKLIGPSTAATKQAITEIEAMNAGVAALETAIKDLAAAKSDEALLTSTNYVTYADVTAAKALPEKNLAEITAKTIAIDAAVAALETNASESAEAVALAAVVVAEGSVVQADHDAANVLVTALSADADKTLLVGRLTAVQALIDAHATALAALNEAKADEARLKSTDYTSYAGVTAALGLAEVTTADINTKTSAINAAIAALVHV